MSGLNCAFEEFYQASKIQNVIIEKRRRFDNYSTKLYCLKKDIDVNKEKQRLFNLCLNYGVGYNCSNWDINFDTKKIISVKPSYFSTYIFTFSKKTESLFFYYLTYK